jgi:TadE-like protein
MKLLLPRRFGQRQAAIEPTIAKSRGGCRPGQSLVETALLMPFLLILLSVVIEAGLAINAWIRVNDAARDATRFAVDAGRSNDVSSLVLSKLQGIDFGSNSTGSNNLNVYLIKGITDNSGQITDSAWAADTNHVYGPGGGAASLGKVTLLNRLAANGENPDNVPFVIVEVDFNYTPLLGTLIAPTSKLPMTSYALIQQY